MTSVDGLAAHCGLAAVAFPHQSRSSVHRQRPRRREPIRLASNNHNGDDHDDRDQIHADGLHSRVQRHIRSTLAATLTFLACDWSSPVGRSCQCCSAQNLVGDICRLSCLIRSSGEVWLLLSGSCGPQVFGELGIAPSRPLYYAKGVVALRVRVFHFPNPNLLLASQYLQDRFSAQTDL